MSYENLANAIILCYPIEISTFLAKKGKIKPCNMIRKGKIWDDMTAKTRGCGIILRLLLYYRRQKIIRLPAGQIR